MSKKVLYFEGAGLPDTYRGEISNCRIRTAFTNNEGKKIYLEILGSAKVGEAIGFIDSCHYLTDDKAIDDCNNSRLQCERKGHISYSYNGILEFVNKNCNCSFDSIEVLGWLSGYRVFRETTKETYNTFKAYNYGDEFQYDVSLETKRKEIEKHFYNLEKSEGKKYPNCSLWVDENNKNILHLLRHFNGYNKHWTIDANTENWIDTITETKLGKYAC